jgi:hypothetical protein
MQPLVLDDVVAAPADVATAEPKNDTVGIAGLELIRMDEFVRRFLMANKLPSYAVCKPLTPTPSASSFVNKPHTDCPVLGSVILSNPALAELMATGLPRTEHPAVRPQPLLGLEGSQSSPGGRAGTVFAFLVWYPTCWLEDSPFLTRKG